jgi:hypothetical protein
MHDASRLVLCPPICAPRVQWHALARTTHVHLQDLCRARRAYWSYQKTLSPRSDTLCTPQELGEMRLSSLIVFLVLPTSTPGCASSPIRRVLRLPGLNGCRGLRLSFILYVHVHALLVAVSVIARMHAVYFVCLLPCCGTAPSAAHTD